MEVVINLARVIVVTGALVVLMVSLGTLHVQNR